MPARMGRRRLLARDSNRMNGSAKWATSNSMAMPSQPPWVRCKYQGTSSARLPDQMIKNCEKLDIGPQHDKGEQQIAQVMHMRRAHDVGKRCHMSQSGEDKNGKGERHQQLTDDEQHAIDG